MLAAAPLALLGLISYGVYLWHLTIAELVALASMPTHFTAPGLDLAGRIPDGATPVMLVLTLAASCAVAAAQLPLRGAALPASQGALDGRDPGGPGSRRDA